MAIIGAFAYIQFAEASLTVDQPALINQYRAYQLFASTTNEAITSTSTNATSTNIVSYFNANGVLVTGFADLRGAKEAVFYFSVSTTTGGTTGTSTFTVQVSPDGVNWQNFNRLVQDVATTATPAYVGSVQLPASGPTATTTSDYYMDLTGGYMEVRCISAQANLSLATNAGCELGVTY